MVGRLREREAGIPIAKRTLEPLGGCPGGPVGGSAHVSLRNQNHHLWIGIGKYVRWQSARTTLHRVVAWIPD